MGWGGGNPRAPIGLNEHCYVFLTRHLLLLWASLEELVLFTSCCVVYLLVCVYQEEQAQSKALDMLWTKKKGYRIPPIVPIIEGPSLSSDHTPGNLGVEVDIDGEQWIVAESKQGKSEC